MDRSGLEELGGGLFGLDGSPPPWERSVGGLSGCFAFDTPCSPGESLGPIVPDQFKRCWWNAFDRACLLRRDPRETSVVWVPLHSESPCRPLGNLLEVTAWAHCESWARAVDERAAIEGATPRRLARSNPHRL